MTTRFAKTSRPRRLGASRQTPYRAGTILPGLVVALVVTLCCVALVLDRLWLDAASTELRTASEAAALAAAGELIHDDLLREHDDQQARLEAARQKAAEAARQNHVAGQPVELDASPEGDVQFGRLVRDEESGITRFLLTTVEPRTVAVRCSRQRSRGNPVALFFRGITGQAQGDAASYSQATASHQILGVRPFEDVAVPGLPLAILKCDPAGLRADTWDNQILNRGGSDQYRYNPETNTVELGEDGIREIQLHSKKQDESAIEANVQLVDLNTDLRTDPLLEQFNTGWTANALNEFGGELVFHPGSIWMTSSATMDGDHAWGLEELIGQPRICLLYSELLPAGREGYGKLQAVDLVAGRIMAVHHNDDGQHVLVFQPTVLTTKTAILASEVMDLSSLSPAERNLLDNSYIYKLHLTR